MKNKKYLAISFIQMIILATIFVLDKLTKIKMGMARHMVYVNSKMPIFVTEYADKIFLIITIIIAIVLLKMTRNENIKYISKILFAIEIGYALGMSVEKTRFYFATLAFLTIINLLEIFKVHITEKK